MKLNALLLCLLFFYSSSYAQNKGTNKTFNSDEKQWLFRMTGGTSIDLSKSGSDSYPPLLGRRPEVAPFLDLRMTWLFAERWGGYADLQMNFYKEKKAEYLNSDAIGDIGEALLNKLFWPVSILRPSLDAGIVYRIEKNKWNFHPEIGLGYGYYLPNRNSTEQVTNAESGKKEVSYKQEASGLYLKTGFSVNYFLTKKSFLVFHANYREPLQKAHGEVTFNGGSDPVKISQHSNSLGRSIDFGVGIGFAIGK